MSDLSKKVTVAAAAVAASVAVVSSTSLEPAMVRRLAQSIERNRKIERPRLPSRSPTYAWLMEHPQHLRQLCRLSLEEAFAFACKLGLDWDHTPVNCKYSNGEQFVAWWLVACGADDCTAGWTGCWHFC
jgi:hypothetical protein